MSRVTKAGDIKAGDTKDEIVLLSVNKCDKNAVQCTAAVYIMTNDNDDDDDAEGVHV